MFETFEDLFIDRKDKESTTRAIYELSGDRLNIGWTRPRTARLKGFGDKADDKRRLAVLERVKADKSDDKK